MEEDNEEWLMQQEVAVLTPMANEDDFDKRLMELAQATTDVDHETKKLKILKARRDALSYSLAQYMIASGCSKKVLNNIQFSQKQRVFSKVEDKEALRQWIIENDAVALLMTVHPSKLTAYCNERLEAGGETPTGVNPNYIKYFVHVK